MYYYVGFAYMMMRRYADAIRTFSNILLYIQRTRGLFQVRLAGSWSLPPIQEVLQNVLDLIDGRNLEDFETKLNENENRIDNIQTTKPHTKNEHI